MIHLDRMRGADSREIGVSLREVAAAGRRPAERLSHDLRWFLLGVVIAGSLVAASHHVLLGALASADGGWASAAVGFLSWPHPAVQPLFAGAGASGVALIYVMTAGFTIARPGHLRALLILCGTTALGVVSTVLFLVVFVGFWLLAVALVVAVVVLILAAMVGGS